MWAAEKGYEGIIELFLQNNVDIDAKAKNDDTDIVYNVCVKATIERLLQNTGDVNEKDYYGNTALMWATKQNNEVMVKPAKTGNLSEFMW